MTKYLTHKTTIQGKAETLRRREVRRVKYGTTPTLFNSTSTSTSVNKAYGSLLAGRSN